LNSGFRVVVIEPTVVEAQGGFNGLDVQPRGKAPVSGVARFLCCRIPHCFTGKRAQSWIAWRQGKSVHSRRVVCTHQEGPRVGNSGRLPVQRVLTCNGQVVGYLCLESQLIYWKKNLL